MIAAPIIQGAVFKGYIAGCNKGFYACGNDLDH